MIRCGVIGQSNSVMKLGFASHLSAEDGIQVVKRAAIGASSAILAPFLAPPEFGEGLDYCVVDLAVFDYFVAASSNGKYTGYEISRILEYLIHTLKACGCEPIFLVMAPQWANLKHGWIGDLHLQVAKTQRCFYFDFCAFAKSTLGTDTASISSIYADSNHPNSACQQAIAAKLAAFMRHQLLSQNELVEIRGMRPSYDVVSLTGIEDAALGRFMRESSLASAEFFVLAPGREWKLPLPAGSLVRGIVINSVASFGKLELLGDGRVIKPLSPPGDSPHHFLLQAVSIFGNVGPIAGEITLRMTDDESTEPHTSVVTPKQAMSVSVEMSALVVECAEVSYSYKSPFRRFDDLDVLGSRI